MVRTWVSDSSMSIGVLRKAGLHRPKCCHLNFAFRFSWAASKPSRTRAVPVNGAPGEGRTPLYPHVPRTPDPIGHRRLGYFFYVNQINGGWQAHDLFGL